MSQPDTLPRGRAARRAERLGRGGGPGLPFLRRGIPTLDPLSDEGLARLEAAADRILAEVGIEFRDDPAALALWRRAGAEVQDCLVRFPPRHAA